MKNSIKLFVTTLLISVLFISCGGGDELEIEAEKQKEQEVSKSIKFNKSDNSFLADDVSTKINETRKEIKAVISVLLSPSEFDNDIILKYQIGTSKNTSVSEPITIVKGATEVPIKLILNGKKVVYTLKFRINYLNKALVEVVHPKDLIVLYELSNNSLIKSVFKNNNIDFNTMTNDQFIVAIKNMEEVDASLGKMFGFNDDERIIKLNLLSIKMAKLSNLKALNLLENPIDELPPEIEA